jgi:hypothetical protein
MLTTWPLLVGDHHPLQPQTHSKRDVVRRSTSFLSEPEHGAEIYTETL